MQRPRPGRPSRDRAILVSRGSTRWNRSLPSCPPPSLLPPPASLLLSRAPAGGFQSQQRPPPPTLTAGGRGGSAGSGAEPGGRGGPPGDGAARAHWEYTRRAPPRTRKEPSARRKRPKGPRFLAPGCRVGGPAAVKGAPGCCLGGFFSARSRQPLLTKKPHCRRRGAASLWKPCQAYTVRGTPQPRAARGPGPLGQSPFWQVLGVDYSDKLILHLSASWWAGEISLIAQNPHTVVWRQRKHM